jgi:hypothetical protein
MAAVRTVKGRGECWSRVRHHLTVQAAGTSVTYPSQARTLALRELVLRTHAGVWVSAPWGGVGPLGPDRSAALGAAEGGGGR